MKVDLNSRELQVIWTKMGGGGGVLVGESVEEAGEIGNLRHKIREYSIEAKGFEDKEVRQKEIDQRIGKECEEKIRELFGVYPIRALQYDECGHPNRWLFIFTDLEFNEAHERMDEFDHWFIKDPEQRCRLVSFHVMINYADLPDKFNHPEW